MARLIEWDKLPCIQNRVEEVLGNEKRMRLSIPSAINLSTETINGSQQPEMRQPHAEEQGRVKVKQGVWSLGVNKAGESPVETDVPVNRVNK